MIPVLKIYYGDGVTDAPNKAIYYAQHRHAGVSCFPNKSAVLDNS